MNKQEIMERCRQFKKYVFANHINNVGIIAEFDSVNFTREGHLEFIKSKTVNSLVFYERVKDIEEESIKEGEAYALHIYLESESEVKIIAYK